MREMQVWVPVRRCSAVVGGGSLLAAHMYVHDVLSYKICPLLVLLYLMPPFPPPFISPPLFLPSPSTFRTTPCSSPSCPPAEWRIPSQTASAACPTAPASPASMP